LMRRQGYSFFHVFFDTPASRPAFGAGPQPHHYPLDLKLNALADLGMEKKP
jgi:hypothetical protein